MGRLPGRADQGQRGGAQKVGSVSSQRQKPGRPAHGFQRQAEDAAKVLEIALAVKQGRLAWLQAQGFHDEGAAMRFVRKRRRGTVGKLIGRDIEEMLFPPTSNVACAIRYVLDAGMSVNAAARLAGVDLRTVRRELPHARKKQAQQAARVLELRVQVTSVN